jgi:hypothetical protein
MSTTTQAKSTQWRFYSYDVWGNAKDGYEVNNVFSTSDVIEIPESIQGDAELFRHLKKIGFINEPYLRVNKFETDHNEDTIYFSYDGKPEGEFRREQPENFGPEIESQVAQATPALPRKAQVSQESEECKVGATCPLCKGDRMLTSGHGWRPCPACSPYKL